MNRGVGVRPRREALLGDPPKGQADYEIKMEDGKYKIVILKSNFLYRLNDRQECLSSSVDELE